MNTISKIFKATINAAIAAWAEGKYTFLLHLRSSAVSDYKNFKKEQEEWLRAFEDADAKAKSQQ